MNTDRRRLLGLLAGVTAGGAGASAFARSGRASAGATFAASDVRVESANGTLAALTVAPAGTVSWSGLETPAGGVSLALYAKLDADLRYHELASQRLPAAGLHGETDYEFGTRNLLGGEGFSPDQFRPDDGGTRSRTVRLRLAVTVYAGNGETELTTGYADASFVVTVENPPEATDADGEANTDAEAETETTTTKTTTNTTTETTTDATTTTEEPTTDTTKTTETTTEGTTTTEEETTTATTEE